MMVRLLFIPSSETLMTFRQQPQPTSTESYIHYPQPEWTEQIYLKVELEKSLGLSTGLTSIDVVLQEVHGSRDVFAGFNRKLWPQRQYFFWNSITQSCDRITNPLGRDKIIEQIKKDIKKVTVEPYDEEDAEEDAEEDTDDDG
jgi:hypothetical protein